MSSKGRTKYRPLPLGLDTNWGPHQFKLRALTLTLDYPLRVGVQLEIEPMVWQRLMKDGRVSHHRELSPGYLMWVLAREYARIYGEHQKYGVWGHALDDLYFEGFRVGNNGLTHVWIGS